MDAKVPPRPITRDFKVFDQVLVRNSVATDWHPGHFAKCSSDMDRPYKTLTGEFWAYCIPFDGNEDLLMEWECCRHNFPDGKCFEPFERCYMDKGKTEGWQPRHFLYRSGDGSTGGFPPSFFDLEGNGYAACLSYEGMEDDYPTFFPPESPLAEDYFTEVLVRFRPTHRWEPNFLGGYNRITNSYITIYNNFDWTYCIKFEGNERYLDSKEGMSIDNIAVRRAS
jgi:hypothetical protein